MARTPEGTRLVSPQEWAWREQLRQQLEAPLIAHGFLAVQTPALERFTEQHPLADKSFKLIDRDGSVLALRAEYTTAIANLARQIFPTGPWPLRLCYSGPLWIRARDSEVGRMREYSQVGAELMGVSTPQADSEVVNLVGECLQAVGFTPTIELGHPGFVRAVLQETNLSNSAQEELRALIDRKDEPGLATALKKHAVGGVLQKAILNLPQAFGGREAFALAEHSALNTPAKEALAWLEEVANSLGNNTIFDFGIARRFDYYSGLYFRAYAPDFAQPLAGGGRYDGANENNTAIPAVGFAIGLERLMTALGAVPELNAPIAIAKNMDAAKLLRTRGAIVENAWTENDAALFEYARAKNILYILHKDHAIKISDGTKINLEEIL